MIMKSYRDQLFYNYVVSLRKKVTTARESFNVLRLFAYLVERQKVVAPISNSMGCPNLIKSALPKMNEVHTLSGGFTYHSPSSRPSTD